MALAVAALISPGAYAIGVETNANIFLGNATDPSTSVLRSPVQAWSYQAGETAATGVFDLSFSGLDSSGQMRAGHFTGSAWAQSDYGVLKSYSMATLTKPMLNAANPIYTDGSSINPEGVPTTFSAGSSAYFSDAISGLGNVASIRIKLGVTARVDHPGSLGTWAGISLLQTEGTRYDYVNMDLLHGALFGDVNKEVLSDAIPVVGGVAHFGFLLMANVNFDPGHSPALEGGTFTGGVDASHTALLDMVYGYNATGQLVSMAGASASSGTTYTYAAAAPVPEPTSWLLLSAGLLFGATVRQRRGHQVD